jgi:hypothetical protein
MWQPASTRHAGCEMGLRLVTLATRLPLMGWSKMRLQHRSWLRTPLVMWLGLAISLTLLCVSNTVLAHDIYSDLHDRDGRLCCNGQDCKPVQVTVLPNGSYYLPSTGEIIPADMATPSPNELFHHCIYYPMATEFDRSGPVWESKPKTRCFFAPMNSM